MKKYYHIIIASILFLMFGCTEIIEIDFKDLDSQYVIEANISTTQDPVVTISSTIHFDETNDFPEISGGSVALTDNFGNVNVLSEIADGLYTKIGFRGQEGLTYTLNVNINGETFSSESKIPEQVKLDSLSLEKIVASMWTTIDDVDSVYNLFAHFQDPGNTDNYYFFIEYINGVQIRSFTNSDYYSNGRYHNLELHTHDRALQKGDTVTVEMRCIDENVYDYFVDIDANNAMSATPTNPKTNIQNAKLGYFSAHTSEIQFMIVP